MDLSTLMPQQRDIVTTLDRPLFVSAGAGSGKTFTLTRRILWALSPESGPFASSLDQVLAITFTKDAAAEIRERVRAALIAEGMREEALSVDDAWISTIHGMCARILRAHALELGIDPEFTVVEDASELLDRAVERVIGRVEAGDGVLGRDTYRALLSWYPLKGEAAPGGFEAGASVQGLVRRLLELACSLPGGMDDVHLAGGFEDFSGLEDGYRACLSASPKAAQIASRALAAIEAYRGSARTAADLAGCMMACDMPRASKAFPKEQVALLRAEAADAFVNAYLACGAPALSGLKELARAVEAEYRSLKDEAHALDNNDLLRLAHEALRDRPAVRAAYADRFKLVMIDEFQDTDQQQVDLISYLTGDGGRALCTVGDAQQSIYRFRGAEVEVFRRQERAIGGGSRASARDEGDVGVPDAARGAQAASQAPGSAGGRVVKLVKNFRSHREILEYVARVFDGERGGLMRDFLDLEAHDGRANALLADASRRSALLVVGGTTEQRARAKAAGIAHRFRALADAGQPVGDMVLLLGAMTRADLYADAFRAEGLDCVIVGGSVFSSTPEVASVRALVCALANPADTARGLVSLLASPLFGLGVQEFLALATSADAETGETRRRNVDAGIMSDEDAPGLDGLPLVARARAVMRRAFGRVGRDGFAQIARDVVGESGWLVRLADKGPQGRASAANVLKALDMLAEVQERVGNAPRSIACAFDAALAGKQAPGALNARAGGAVRIMTVHASKGLEFPVVAVAECFSIKRNSDRMQTRRSAGRVDVVAMPQRFPSTRTADGQFVSDAQVEARFGKYLREWLTPALTQDVSATGSAAEAFVAMRADAEAAELAERARLLYVAMTRAREVLILAMDARVSSGRDHAVAFDDERDLTRAVLSRILPDEGACLDVGRLVFDNARPGDFAFTALAPCSFAGVSYEADERAVAAFCADGDGADDGAPASRCHAGEDGGEKAGGAPASSDLDTFTLVYPPVVPATVAPAPRRPRDSYSYSSIAAELGGANEDRAEPSAGALPAGSVEPAAFAPMPSGDAFAADAVYAVEDVEEAGRGVRVAADAGDARDGGAAGDADAPDGEATALGSAFHAAAQWMVEMGRDDIPAPRIDALCRAWRLSDAARGRLERAVARWAASAVRREALSWPCVRAEVPFFALGSDELHLRFGTYAEGAIDLLCTDPAHPERALVIDYKTGGRADETPDELRAKHELQARVYADALARAGCTDVELRFVRVEHDDVARPGEPQTVTYRLRSPVA